MGNGGSDPKMSVLIIRDRRGETQTQRRSPVKTEAETGGLRPKAQGCLEPPEAGRGRKHPPLEPLEGVWLLGHLDFRRLVSRTVRA